MRLAEYKTISGVYKITNRITNKCYIGQTEWFPMRIYEHIKDLIKNKHHCQELQDEFIEHGLDNFEVELIEECNRSELLEREKFYINKYQSNLLNTINGKTHLRQ